LSWEDERHSRDELQLWLEQQTRTRWQNPKRDHENWTAGMGPKKERWRPGAKNERPRGSKLSKNKNQAETEKVKPGETVTTGFNVNSRETVPVVLRPNH
jgi:hypothetical protein